MAVIAVNIATIDTTLTPYSLRSLVRLRCSQTLARNQTAVVIWTTFTNAPPLQAERTVCQKTAGNTKHLYTADEKHTGKRE